MSGYIGTQPVPQATQTRQTFVATAAQTSFATAGYSVGYLDIHLNGVKLQDGVDYAAENGSDIVLTVGAAAGDVLEFVAYTAFEVADTVSASGGGAFAGNVLVGTTDTTLYNNTSGSGILLNGSGEIGVATTNGNCAYFNRMSSNGNNIRLFNRGSQVGNISTTSSSTTYSTTSDRRLKDNIQPIANATEKLMVMKPVTHTWIADPQAEAVVGFIAQEMQEVVPEAVTGNPDGEEMMSMDYGRITPVLVAALQESLKRIEALEAQLTELGGH